MKRTNERTNNVRSTRTEACPLDRGLDRQRCGSPIPFGKNIQARILQHLPRCPQQQRSVAKHRKSESIVSDERRKLDLSVPTRHRTGREPVQRCTGRGSVVRSCPDVRGGPLHLHGSLDSVHERSGAKPQPGLRSLQGAATKLRAVRELGPHSEHGRGRKHELPGTLQCHVAGCPDEQPLSNGDQKRGTRVLRVGVHPGWQHRWKRRRRLHPTQASSGRTTMHDGRQGL
mmetsp:Transcript_4298/g.10056  ORF Transcript_4298/g.10056 Transcript_4298/m.10056 type:complete len:229 (-) Transcript_4298:370-1056(-)